MMLVVALLAAFTPSTFAYGDSTQQGSLATVKARVACTKLEKVDLTAIGGAGSAVTEASAATHHGSEVCSVTGRLAPNITFQVRLPKTTWTQRYLQLGCGGLCGHISLNAAAVDGCSLFDHNGFAVAATDMGHRGAPNDDGSWGLDPQQRVDFAYRAQHLTALAAKALIEAFYGQPAKYAYFNGCSDGGREAMMEALRYPTDFDGIVAGAPAMLFQVQNTLYHAWQARSNTDSSGKVRLRSARLPILHRAVLAACDELDGAKDGLISRPAACNFDLRTITCATRAADRSQCLTKTEAQVAQKFYDGPHDANTGVALTAGQPLYGSELEWAGVYVADKPTDPLMSTGAALAVIRHLAFERPQPQATLTTFQFSEGTLRKLRARHRLFDSTSTDLFAFQHRGGKLILWHGLADPHIAPANTVAYHQGLVARFGQRRVNGFERLYLLPGVAHCGDGQGPSAVDLLTPLMAWVEQDKAPEAIMTRSAPRPAPARPTRSGRAHPRLARSGPAHPRPAHPRPAQPVMTRPVYPFPSTARYKGKGDVYDAANWEQGPPLPIVHVRPWAGSELFRPYAFRPR